MTPTTCSRCGAPLPAVAADQRHPDWCPTCAARAVGELGPSPVSESITGARPGAPRVGAPPVAPPPPLALDPAPRRYLEGAVIGVAAAGIGGVVWWAVCSVTGLQLDLVSLLLGLFVGQAVLIGSRRGGPVPALVALVAVLLSLTIAQYFIERSAAIADFGAELPLWMGFSTARRVVSDSLTNDSLRGLSWLVAGAAAVVSCGAKTRRALF